MTKKENNFCILSWFQGMNYCEGKTPTLLGAKRLAKRLMNTDCTVAEPIIYRAQDVDCHTNKLKKGTIERWFFNGCNWTHELRRNGCWGRAALEAYIKDQQERGFYCEVFLVNKEAVNDWYNYLPTIRSSSDLRRRIPKKGSVTYVGTNFDDVVEFCRAFPWHADTLLESNAAVDTNDTIHSYSYFTPEKGTLYFVEVD